MAAGFETIMPTSRFPVSDSVPRFCDPHKGSGFVYDDELSMHVIVCVCLDCYAAILKDSQGSGTLLRLHCAARTMMRASPAQDQLHLLHALLLDSIEQCLGYGRVIVLFRLQVEARVCAPNQRCEQSERVMGLTTRLGVVLSRDAETASPFQSA